MANSCLSDGPRAAPLTLLLAHGAGAGMDSPFMARMAEGIGALGFRVLRFEFPYMAATRKDGRKRPPDRPAVLLESFAALARDIAGTIGPDRLILGGKSMGGRIASMLADPLEARGLVVFGYPFHAPGKPDSPRIEALKALVTPALILQGSRDPFGKPEEIAGYPLSPSIRLHVLEDGDHGFKPRKSSGRTEPEALDEAIAAAGAFLAERLNG